MRGTTMRDHISEWCTHFWCAHPGETIIWDGITIARSDDGQRWEVIDGEIPDPLRIALGMARSGKGMPGGLPRFLGPRDDR